MTLVILQLLEDLMVILLIGILVSAAIYAASQLLQLTCEFFIWLFIKCGVIKNDENNQT